MSGSIILERRHREHMVAVLDRHARSTPDTLLHEVSGVLSHHMHKTGDYGEMGFVLVAILAQVHASFLALNGKSHKDMEHSRVLLELIVKAIATAPILEVSPSVRENIDG